MPSLLQRGGASVKYHKVNTVDDGFVDAQFRKPPPKPPIKSILLAVFLFTFGSLLLIIGSLLFTGYIDVQVCFTAIFCDTIVWNFSLLVNWVLCRIVLYPDGRIRQIFT